MMKSYIYCIRVKLCKYVRLLFIESETCEFCGLNGYKVK